MPSDSAARNPASDVEPRAEPWSHDEDDRQAEVWSAEIDGDGRHAGHGPKPPGDLADLLLKAPELVRGHGAVCSLWRWLLGLPVGLVISSIPTWRK